jgi:DNA-binding NarL/FixJ family response regulator
VVEEKIAQATVVLVDGQELVRDALCQLLSAAGLKVVGQARTGEQGIELATRVQPDVVLIDLVLPTISGVEAIQSLSALVPKSRVLVLTASDDPHAVVEATLAGACGYVLKNAPSEDIVRAVRASAGGECVISSHVAGVLLNRIRERDIPVTARSEQAAAGIRAALTERELEIFRHLPSGMSNRELADELALSESTIKHHVASILAKLHVTNRVQAAAHGIRSGII